MGKLSDEIDAALTKWIADQALFFVGTAPLAATGHINLSPKGPIGSLKVIDAHTLAYLDVVGSGAETIAHLRENGRIVVMLCAFAGPPRIVRIHGVGEVVLPGDRRFAPLLRRHGFADAGVPEARRAIICVHVRRVAESCGYGVPRMAMRGERPQMRAWGERKLTQGGPEAIAEYRVRKNQTSIDGLPAIDDGRRPRGRDRRAPRTGRSV